MKSLPCFLKHGESEMNVQQRIGGDSPLSPNGKMVIEINLSFFRFKLYCFFSTLMHWRNIWLVVSEWNEKKVFRIEFCVENIPDLIVWTSQMQRTIQTSAKINAPKEQWKALNEINAVDILTKGIVFGIVADLFSGYMWRFDISRNSSTISGWICCSWSRKILLSLSWWRGKI